MTPIIDLSPSLASRALIDSSALSGAEAALHEAREAVRPDDIILVHTDWAQRAMISERPAA